MAPTDQELARIRTTEMLERGSPDEVLERDHTLWREAARKYVHRDKDQHPPEAVRRVDSVWLEGKYMPPWQVTTKVPDLKLAHRQIVVSNEGTPEEHARAREMGRQVQAARQETQETDFG